MGPRLFAALLLLALSSSPALCQEEGDEADGDFPVAWATLRVDPGRPTTLQLMGRTQDIALAAALEKIGGRPPQAHKYGEWTQWSTELPVPDRQGLVLHQDFDLAPLLQAVAAVGAPSLALQIQYPPAGFSHLIGAKASTTRRGMLSVTLSTSGPISPLSFELGWRLGDLARSITLLLLGLLLPILVALGIWWRSIVRDRAPEQWFLRAQAIQLVSVGGWIGWMVVVEMSGAIDLGNFVLGTRSWPPIAALPFWILGFLPAALGLVTITRRMTRRLRGFDPLPRTGSLSWVRVVSLLTALILAAAGFEGGNTRLGVFSLLACLGLSLLWPRTRGALGMAPQSLSSGALRNRLFELAQRAGVRLRELYVVPMRRERMANAFAVHGGAVILTDELLDRMSKREVDAVLAHEITHLEHHHPIKALWIALTVYALFAAGAMLLKLPYGFALGLLAFLLTHRFVTRRFEFAADAGAAALTTDPEAMISGLGQLGRLNQVPLAWGRGWRWLITHPTTESRAQAIGRRAGLASERVAELLANGIPSGEAYGDRERPGEQERVFSTAWKTAVLSRLGLATLATSVMAPAVGLALAKALGLPELHWIHVMVGAALALLATLLAQNQLAARVVSRLEPALRRRLGGASDERFVALSPGDRARVYEGFLDWDLGLLTIAAGELHYRGEQIELRLPRESMRAIEVGAVAPTWLRAPRVILRWNGPSGEEALTLRAAECQTVSAIGPASRALALALERWRAEGGPSAGVSQPPPGIGPVTARTLAQASAPRDLPLVLVLLGVLSAGAAFVLGLDLWRGLDVFGAALLGILAMRWPSMTSREAPRSKEQPGNPERRAA